MTRSALPHGLLQTVDELIQTRLAPQTQAIDHGLYPADFLRTLGQLGGFAAALPSAEGGLNLNLAAQVDLVAQVARTCGSTAFLVWCQAICTWYLHQTHNPAARERYLKPLAAGTLLAGTGMSNAVKHLAGIERINLRGHRDGTDFVVNGALPWVSNLGEDHLLIAAAELDEGGYVMFVVPPHAPALTLRACPAFSGMEGTGTLNVRLKNARIPADDVLADADEFDAYMKRIKSGFLLTQAGMGLGLIQASVDAITASNVRLAHVNCYLDDQSDTLARDLDALHAETTRLANQGQSALPLDVLRVRARSSELALRATQSAALHTGAAGYLLSNPSQRRLREALFVAIVTPALKHLRKEIDGLEHAREAA
ncbi:MAG: acyl-CoA dehydrogenase [Castellaniella sp.]|uniref:acyl-CoA dehydrogenase family protein n=1 Tax=Castellaniella sp. TaxID=1955812 RepID=UPI0012067A47|nr:acyl-CoA dehydrogenase family protein [Castellaniella sp.]TAN27806.1 MAG: acyl-CoA dehydrogenase [Castellaniella sp.]